MRITVLIAAIALAFATNASGAEPQLSDPDSFTIVALPDTQVYSQSYPEHFHAQTRWIVENRDRLNIQFVLHLGDITNHNTPPHWKNAKAAMRRLDGEVPYALAAGNHDYGPGGNASDRTTLLNDYFHVSDYKELPTFGGVMEKGRLDNSYHTFEVRGQKFLVLALEWGPRKETVEWANSIVADHPEHRGILITHAYMYSDENRYDWEERGSEQSWNPHSYGTAKLPGGVNDGQELWDKLVNRHPNFIMTLNGHVLNDGRGRLTSEGKHGNRVHQMLVNFQTREEGGNGHLRLIEFLPDGQTVKVLDWSPVLEQPFGDDQSEFTLELSPPLELAAPSQN